MATVAVVTGREVVGISRTERLGMDLVFLFDCRKYVGCWAEGAP